MGAFHFRSLKGRLTLSVLVALIGLVALVNAVDMFLDAEAG